MTVSGTETWSSPLDETVEVTRWDDSALTLNQFVTVADGGSLTLENVALDGLYGEAETSVNTIVSVAAGGSLTLADGAAVRGSAGSGVSVAGGSVTLAGGEISGNKGRGINATGASTVKVVSGRITGNGRNGVYLDWGQHDHVRRRNLRKLRRCGRDGKIRGAPRRRRLDRRRRLYDERR